MKSRGAIIVNLLFWLLVVTIISVRLLNNPSKIDFFDLWVTFGYYGVINVSLFFINSLILIPDLIKKRQKSWLYLFIVVGLIAVSVVIKTGLAVVYPDIILQFKDRSGKLQYMEYSQYMIQVFFTSGFFIVISSLLKLRRN